MSATPPVKGVPLRSQCSRIKLVSHQPSSAPCPGTPANILSRAQERIQGSSLTRAEVPHLRYKIDNMSKTREDIGSNSGLSVLDKKVACACRAPSGQGAPCSILVSNLASQSNAARGRRDQSTGAQPSIPPAVYLPLVHMSKSSCPVSGGISYVSPWNICCLYLSKKARALATRSETLP